MKSRVIIATPNGDIIVENGVISRRGNSNIMQGNHKDEITKNVEITCRKKNYLNKD